MSRIKKTCTNIQTLLNLVIKCWGQSNFTPLIILKRMERQVMMACEILMGWGQLVDVWQDEVHVQSLELTMLFQFFSHLILKTPTQRHYELYFTPCGCRVITENTLQGENYKVYPLLVNIFNNLTVRIVDLSITNMLSAVRPAGYPRILVENNVNWETSEITIYLLGVHSHCMHSITWLISICVLSTAVS